MTEGWIKLHRGITNNPLWTQEQFSRGQAWVDLILMVNHEDKKILFDGGLVECKRGERITSIRQLGERWKWSRDKIKRFLDLLKSDGMITYKTDHKKTVINVVNYSVYQDKSTQEKPVKSHRKATKKSLTDTNKNDKENIKNDKEEKEREEEYITQTFSFQTPIHEKLFEQFGEISYKTWFEDCEIEEKEHLIIITAKEIFKKNAIENGYSKIIGTLIGKNISVKTTENENYV